MCFLRKLSEMAVFFQSLASSDSKGLLYGELSLRKLKKETETSRLYICELVEPNYIVKRGHRRARQIEQCFNFAAFIYSPQKCAEIKQYVSELK